MFTELVDRLRCPRPHADAWLVAAVDATHGRRIVRGTLGCPICDAEYPILEGVAQFGDDDTRAVGAPTIDATTVTPDADAREDAADRLAAQLHLVEAPEPVLLVGTWSALAHALLLHYPHVVALVADTTTAVAMDERLSPVTLPAARYPLADASIRAIALDDAHAREPWLADAARIATTGARLVVPRAVTPPSDCWSVVASDAHVHVATRAARASAPVPLRRAPARHLFDPPG